MKQALNNIDAYLGAMAQTQNCLFGVRVWVLVPKVLQTNFRYKEGWGIEGALITKLPEWDWISKGVEPVEFAVMLAADPLDAEPRGGGNSKEITVKAVGEETPYILLAFENTVTEEEIQNTLSVTKKDESDRIDINWVGKDGEIDPTAEINAGTDLITNNEDGKEYRVVLLRLKEGGTYVVNTGALDIQKSQKATVTPFEKLELSLSGNQVSGEVKYAEDGTEYTLRTYLGSAKGEATYLMDEQTVTGSNSISPVTIPTSGTHAPTGNYYVTSFLMTEKTTTVADENGESENVTALMAIDSQQFDKPITYTNANEPDAPAWAKLEFVGNEVMRAEWEGCRYYGEVSCC